MNKTRINWLKIEEIVRRSFIGGSVTHDETKYCEKALKEDRKKYIDITSLIREEERNKIKCM